MPAWLKKYMPFMIIAVVLLFIVRKPDDASHGVHQIWSGIISIGDALGRFVSGLLHG